MKEATARIKINKLLETAGWRFFSDGQNSANIRLEPKVAIGEAQLDAFGENFEAVSRGFVDFLLLNDRGKPVAVLEAKSENINPLSAKEQARSYARSADVNCRFIILSNGNLHYFWDLERGNPHIISSFPTPQSITSYKRVTPDPQRLIDELITEDYIAQTQKPRYEQDAAWKHEVERGEYIKKNSLRFLRPYQLKALVSVQHAVAKGKDRFLFEMATGTGKTLTSAAIIQLFLRSGNAQRVLFLVDRLELEDQAKKAFEKALRNNYKTVIYKDNRDDWRHAEIVVTTVQSLLFNNKYQSLFSPTDFDLVISDEAHRSIGGNARAVFDYFVGYKLGLTATPRDYLKKFDAAAAHASDPREGERRLMLDTYRTFGCETGEPTFRYSLIDGVKEGYLISPTVVDARTEVTAKLLSEQGFAVRIAMDTQGDGESEERFAHTAFEKRFFFSEHQSTALQNFS
jgi:type I restriction enzyme, R subunit